MSEWAIRDRCDFWQDGKHQPQDWRAWRQSEKNHQPVWCECGQIIWPVCSVCHKPRVEWAIHVH